MPRPKELIGQARLPGGQELRLTAEGGYFVLALDGVPLMTSAAHHSEEHLAEVGCEGLLARAKSRVLIGGLGMGYTLRAALDRTCATSCIVVAELVPAVVAWNQGPLAELAGRPLEDPRTQIRVVDVVAYIASRPAPFDAILLDTDNGPDDFTAKGNAHLYDQPGLARLWLALNPGGRLVVWSAYQCPAFVDDLRRAGFEPQVVRAKARGHKGGRHTLYVGRRPKTDREPASPGTPRRVKTKRRQPDRRRHA